MNPSILFHQLEWLMEESYLYRQIADDIRRQILQGKLKPGDRLPSVRQMTTRWRCTVGTAQRAYQELASQGLVTSHAGQGTRVTDRLPTQDNIPLRRAALVHRAETFLLEVLTAGYTPVDVEDAVRQALERWRAVARPARAPVGSTLRFVGSHDLAMAWLATHFGEIAAGYALDLSFTGSLGGLIALAENKADLAGCHLWDEETGEYNAPFVRRLLPGQPITLITLAHRQIGLIVATGNPLSLRELPDLTRPGVRFVNRQSGSGTRVWLDAQLRRLGVAPQAIRGYSSEQMTHSEVAQAIAEGQADVGLGLAEAAHIYGLGFAALTQERYDLIIPEVNLEATPIQRLITWLKQPAAKEAIASFSGYGADSTGELP
jgi:molybdate-binding protein/DNA-binding transcriptional regulator YhcF (GntR family)